MQMYLRTNERYDFFYIFHLKTELRYLRIYFARTIEGAVNVFRRREVTMEKLMVAEVGSIVSYMVRGFQRNNYHAYQIRNFIIVNL